MDWCCMETEAEVLAWERNVFIGCPLNSLVLSFLPNLFFLCFHESVFYGKMRLRETSVSAGPPGECGDIGLVPSSCLILQSNSSPTSVPLHVLFPLIRRNSHFWFCLITWFLFQDSNQEACLPGSFWKRPRMRLLPHDTLCVSPTTAPATLS